MDRVILIGVDPGIVDTGVVWILLDRKNKSMRVSCSVWHNVTTRANNSIDVDEEFLEELSDYVQGSVDMGCPVYPFIEGFRNRGRNTAQDQKMTVLVQAIHKAIPDSQIIDNTGVKNVVTESMLRLLQLDRWDIPTNHSDLKSAARIALKGAYQEPALNRLVADVVLDQLMEDSEWTIGKSLAP